MLEVKNLSYSYNRKASALHEINLSLGAGFNLLIGENGSGKTTLIKNMTGILPLQKGQITLGDVPVSCREYQKKISYLPQSFDVYPRLTVREILRFVTSAKSGLDKQTAEQQITNIMELTHISDFAGKKLKDCSEGMRRRVGIATALVGDPEVVILDEPTAGADDRSAELILDLIGHMRGQGCGVVLTSHRAGELERSCTRLLTLEAGRPAEGAP